MSPGPLIKPCSYTAPLISPDVREKLDLERSKIGMYHSGLKKYNSNINNVCMSGCTITSNAKNNIF